MPVTYDLLDLRGGVIPLRAPRLVLNSVGGLGMPPIRRMVHLQAQQDGQTYIDTRLEARVVTFGLDLYAPCEQNLWDMRDDLIRLMGEFANGFVLRVNLLPHGIRRYLDLRYMGGLEMVHDLHVSQQLQNVAFQGIADDPIFYDPTPVVLSYVLGDMAGSFFPITFPHAFGTDEIGTISPVVYGGSWKSFPVIRIVGPATNIVIENATTAETIDLGANTVDSGESVTIDCTPGQKTVTHSVDGNVMSWLTSDSDLATFHIAPHPEASGGVNNISVTLDDAEASTSIIITYYIRYLGI